jgi:hypothetical protein
MKIFAVVNVARQINGDMVFVKVEKAYKNANKVEEFLNQIPQKSNELIENSSGFSIECSCLRSLYEIDVED